MHYVAVYHGMTRLFAKSGGYLEKEIFIGVSMPFVILAFISLLNNKNRTLFWTIVGCILVQLTFLDGADIAHHAYRVIGLVEELHRKEYSGLLINPQTGQAFPIFVYFSFVPYLIAICINLLGISAYISIKLTLSLFLLFFSGGLHLLVTRSCKLRDQSGDPNFQFLIISLFMCSTCIFGLWTLTDELGEIASYAFVPWIALALISGQSFSKLAMLFFVQLIVHPVIFGHALLCVIALAYGISNLQLGSIIRKFMPPVTAALIMATPFWLPQILWVHLIVGNAVLPFKFVDTFLDAELIFSRHFDWAMGPWLILAVALMVIVARGQMNKRAWAMVAAFALILAMQTVYLRGIVMLIPEISIFQFIFRFMVPAAFIALGVLLGFLSPEQRGSKIALSLLLGVAFLNMVVVRIVHSSGNVVPYVYDTQGYANYLVGDNAFGVAMLQPNYARLPINCTHAQTRNIQKVSFKDLLDGSTPSASYVAVANAPIGIVTYQVDGTALAQAACGGDLILGPIPAGRTIAANEGTLLKLAWFRILSMFAALLLFIGLPATARSMS